jgi:hypothetical protein
VNSGGAKPSGLRNPGAAVRGIGAGALATMAVVLLMAIVPLIRLDVPGGAVTTVVVLVVVAVVLCGMLGRAWAWWAGWVVPVALLVAGLWWNVALAVLAVLFGLLWGYVLYVRRSVLTT